MLDVKLDVLERLVIELSREINKLRDTVDYIKREFNLYEKDIKEKYYEIKKLAIDLKHKLEDN